MMWAHAVVRVPGVVKVRAYPHLVSSTDTAVSLGWSAATVPLHTHACFYYSDEQALRRSLAFVRVGLDAPNEFGVIFADASRHESLLGWLQEGYDGDLAAKLAAGELAVVGGAPTREELLGSIASTLDGAIRRGHRLVRFLGFIGWGEPGWPDQASLLEFESQVNVAVLSYPAVIICTYGVPRLSGEQLIHGGLMTHPVVFLNDLALESSPFYMDPAHQTDGDEETA
jgi:hypothetical protein